VVISGTSGSDIRDIILKFVACYFKTYRARAVIEMLTDNGPSYIARDTQISA